MRAQVASGVLLPAIFLAFPDEAAENAERGLVGYGEIASGPAFANFLPLDAGQDAEHLVTGGHQTSFGESALIVNKKSAGRHKDLADVEELQRLEDE